MKRMFFSVIVPVYNAEKYLLECAESILGQTFHDFELILVDDGSTDGSGELCDEIASGDSRVTVLHQQNAGVTKARKEGLLRAGGDYVIYADADDWLDKEFMQETYRILKETDSDLVSVPLLHTGGWPPKSCDPVPAGLYDKKAIEKQIYPKALLGEDMKNMIYTVIGKVVRKSVLLPVQMALPDYLALGEDAACSAALYLVCEKVYISGNAMYHYRVHGESVTHKFRMRLYRQMEEIIHYFEGWNPQEIPDFESQLDRYVMLLLFSAMLLAINEGESGKLTEIEKAMRAPVFRSHIEKAEFKGITPKTRITFWLYKRNMIKVSWSFLSFCRFLKKGQDE